jgi:ubiquinone/menaquinone biosynthesis C-methylase UbiE
MSAPIRQRPEPNQPATVSPCEGPSTEVNATEDDPVTDAFFALHHQLPRQGPGSDASTRRLLKMAGPLPEHLRVLDAGCGPGRAGLLLAAETDAHVAAVDLHQPFLDQLDAAASRCGLAERITTVNCSMADLPYPDHSFDVIWAEGSVYDIGFDTALRAWRRLLAPGGVLVVTEIEWTTGTPSPQAWAFWDPAYSLRTTEANSDAAEAAGYRVGAVLPLPESDWWQEYYTPLTERIAAPDLTVPGMPQAVAATRAEIALRREHGQHYRYPHSHPGTQNGSAMPLTWTTRSRPLRTPPRSGRSSWPPSPPRPRPTWSTPCAAMPTPGFPAFPSWRRPPTAPLPATPCLPAAMSTATLRSPSLPARSCPPTSGKEPDPPPSAVPSTPPVKRARTSSWSSDTPTTTRSSASPRPPASASARRSKCPTRP